MQWVIYIRILDWTATDGAVDECHSCNESVVDTNSSNFQGSISLCSFRFWRQASICLSLSDRKLVQVQKGFCSATQCTLLTVRAEALGECGEIPRQQRKCFKDYA